MAKKNFIRHLEFYGFPDQNVYNGINNVDLSEIHQVNRDQDREIGELSGETQNKADLSLVEELSGKVDTFIDVQSNINESFLESISGMTDRVNALEERDVEITEKINEVADGINADREAIAALSDRVSSVEEGLEEQAANLDSFALSTNERFSAIADSIDAVEESLSGKLDSSVADEIYARNEDVYTKEECDDKFLTEHQDISHLATKDELNELKEEVDEIDLSVFASKEDLDSLSGKVDSNKAETDARLSSDESDIAALSGKVDTLRNDVNGLTDEVTDVRTSVSSLRANVIQLNDDLVIGLSKKLDRTEFNDYANETYDRIVALDNKKADKTALSAVSDSIDSVAADLNAEKGVREAADNALGARIDEISGIASSVDSRISNIEDGFASIEDALAQEIQDRIDGDIALIGSEDDDTMASDTIWGAKKYSEYQRDAAVEMSKTYTDGKFGSIETIIDNKLDVIETKISGKADKTYVDSLVDEKVGEAKDDVENRIDIEVARLNQKDANIEREIADLREEIVSSADTKDIYKRINVITTYSGDTPEEYVDSGNGVLDVLHREFHQLEEEIGVVINPTLERNNEYESAFGTFNQSNTGTDPSEQTIFSVGIGTADTDRRNAIEVRKNGDLYLWVEGEFMKVNDLLAMLAHETYN